jgi:Na+/phosphate symporter
MDYIESAQKTISLLNSMIESGEYHTVKSREMVEHAQKSLNKLYEQTFENTTIVGKLISRERETTKEEIRQWLTEEGFEGLAEKL